MGCWLSYLKEFQYRQSTGSKCFEVQYSSHSKWHKLSRPSVQFIYFSYIDLACFTLMTYTVMIKHYFCLSQWCEHWHKDKKIFCLLFYVHALMLLLWHNKVCQDVHTVKKNKTSLYSYLVILMSPGQEKKNWKSTCPLGQNILVFTCPHLNIICHCSS